MINANELRVGNWLQCKYGNGRISVICDCPNKKRKYIDLSNLDLPIGSFSCEFSFDELEPISLTPVILIAVGFKQLLIDGKKQWKISPNDSFYLYGGNGCYCPNVMPEVQYLHQLQNLYFALIGQELEIKLLTPAAP